MAAPRVGVLALQGDFERHIEILGRLGANADKLRRPVELEDLDGVVLPGGESTTLHKLLRSSGLLEPLAAFAEDHAMLGTCAGSILMATKLHDSGGVEPLSLLDMTVRRNGFGRQIDSFEAELVTTVELVTTTDPAFGVFIRAPRIERVGEALEVLAVYGQEPVAVRDGAKMALTFHPEINGDDRWHRLWLDSLGPGSAKTVRNLSKLQHLSESG